MSTAGAAAAAPADAAAESVTMEDVNSFLEGQTPSACLRNAASLRELAALLAAFVSQNEDPRCSENFNCEEPDELGCLIKLLNEPTLEQNEPLQLTVLKTVKILSRKFENRIEMGKEGIAGVCRTLKRAMAPEIAAESCNVVLNVCYEKENVALFLEAGGVSSLAMHLKKDDSTVDLFANAAGALQSITFQEEGRSVVRDAGVVESMVKLLASESAKVRTRAVGALHNITSDEESIRIVRRQEGIPSLVRMISAPQPAICSSAVGALQNISREVQSCAIIQELGGVKPLIDLLFASEVQAQVAAAGALLNIFGQPEGPDGAPEVEVNVDDPRRIKLRKLLESTIVLARLSALLWTPHVSEGLSVGATRRQQPKKQDKPPWPA